LACPRDGHIVRKRSLKTMELKITTGEGRKLFNKKRKQLAAMTAGAAVHFDQIKYDEANAVVTIPMTLNYRQKGQIVQDTFGVGYMLRIRQARRCTINIEDKRFNTATLRDGVTMVEPDKYNEDLYITTGAITEIWTDYPVLATVIVLLEAIDVDLTQDREAL
jgi:hypothetical protein